MATHEQQDDGVDEIEASRMTLGEHLDELRVRLFRASIAFVLAFSVMYVFRHPVQRFIQYPHARAWAKLEEDLFQARLDLVESSDDYTYEDFFVVGETPEGADRPELVLRDADKVLLPLTSLHSSGPFILAIKICFYLSLFIAGPFLLWEVWMFIAAGLYKNERRVVYGVLPASLGLFLVGNAFGFTVMVPAAIYFMQSDGLAELPVVPRMVDYENYFWFLRSLTLALGFVFQIPIFQIVLSRTGMVDPALYAKYRGHMAVITLVVAAIITPPDPFTQVLLAGPAVLLWEVGYWCARAAWKKQASEVSDELGAPTGA